jgi:hypothetical protein
MMGYIRCLDGKYKKYSYVFNITGENWKIQRREANNKMDFRKAGKDDET